MPVGAPLPRQGGAVGEGPQIAPTSIIVSSLSSAADVSNVPAGESLVMDASSPSSTCTDPLAGTTNFNTDGLKVVKLISGKLRLPEPKRLSNKLSDRQVAMREKAADVGLRFSDAPGVRKAKLDRPVFIKLFTTLVHRESDFEPRAVSPVGARGLGQLMPSTARALGVKDSFAPDENLIGAATYLTDMLDKFGSPELALAAYNAGPGAVEKYKGIPPYRETRQYVADIFHEVLREPRPLYVTSRVSRPDEQPNVDVVLTALAADEPVHAQKDDSPTIPKETAQLAETGATTKALPYAGAPEMAGVPTTLLQGVQRSEIPSGQHRNQGIVHEQKPETFREFRDQDPLYAGKSREEPVTHFAGILDKFGSPAVAMAVSNVNVQKRGDIPDPLETWKLESDDLYHIKHDPQKALLVASPGKQSDTFVAPPIRVSRESVMSELARRSLVKIQSLQSAEPPEMKRQLKRADLAATVSHVAFSEWVTNKLTLGKFIGALGVAFLITGLCSVISDLSEERRRKTPGREEDLPGVGRDPDNAPDVGVALALVTPEGDPDRQGERLRMLGVELTSEQSKAAA